MEINFRNKGTYDNGIEELRNLIENRDNPLNPQLQMITVVSTDQKSKINLYMNLAFAGYRTERANASLYIVGFGNKEKNWNFNFDTNQDRIKDILGDTRFEQLPENGSYKSLGYDIISPDIKIANINNAIGNLSKFNDSKLQEETKKILPY